MCASLRFFFLCVDVRPTRHRPLLLVTPPKQWAEGQGIGRNATQYIYVCVRARTRTRSRTYSCVRCKYTESQLLYSAPSVYFFVPLSSCCYPVPISPGPPHPPKVAPALLPYLIFMTVVGLHVLPPYHLFIQHL